MDRAGSPVFETRESRVPAPLDMCSTHSLRLLFCFLHVGIIIRLAVSGECGHRKPWPIAQKGIRVLLLLELDKSWRKTPVGPFWAIGPSLSCGQVVRVIMSGPGEVEGSPL